MGTYSERQKRKRRDPQQAVTLDTVTEMQPRYIRDESDDPPFLGDKEGPLLMVDVTFEDYGQRVQWLVRVTTYRQQCTRGTQASGLFGYREDAKRQMLVLVDVLKHAGLVGWRRNDAPPS